MKNFKVELHLYPQEFSVEAENEDEAVEKAKQLFSDKNDGASVYSIETVYEEK